MIRNWILLLSLIWVAAACAPADPTRPPTRTPTVTVLRPRLPQGTSVATNSTEGATLGASGTTTVTPLTKDQATLTPSPTVDPLACLPDDEGLTGLVSWVVDGATFVIDIGGRRQTVRLLGIDSVPLTADITRSLIDMRVVRLVPDGPQKDAYGQWLRYVLLLDGRFINDELLRSGAARLDTNVGGLSCLAQFDAAEAVAMQNQLGLWEISAVAVLPTSSQPITATTTPSQDTQALGTLTETMTPTAVITPSGSTPTTTVTSQASPTPPAVTLPPTVTRPAATGTVVGTGVQIVNIFYDGLQEPNEPDEYIEIKNFEATPVDLTDWWIYAEYEGRSYFFPDFTLPPGESCRVYTDRVQDDSCAKDSFLSILPVWNNTGDCGYLFDVDGEEKSVMCFGDYE